MSIVDEKECYNKLELCYQFSFLRLWYWDQFRYSTQWTSLVNPVVSSGESVDPGHRIRYTEGRLLRFSYDFGVTRNSSSNADAMVLASARLRGIHPPDNIQNGGCPGGGMPLKRALARTMASAFWWWIMMAWQGYSSRPSVYLILCPGSAMSPSYGIESM
jgi:hypothetical protein